MTFPVTLVALTNFPVTVSVPSFLLLTVRMFPLTLNVPFFETLTEVRVNDLTPPKPPHVFDLHLSASPPQKTLSFLRLPP